MRLDRVLERGAVDLDRVRDAVERPREHDRAHHEVVGERDVGPHALGDLAHGGDVALEVVVELGVGELGERLRLDPLVAVGDVDRQQAAEVGPVDRRPHRLAPRLERQRAAVPVPGGVDPVQLRTGRAPGRAGGPRGPRARAPRRGARCRRSSPSRAAGSRGRSGSARCGTLAWEAPRRLLRCAAMGQQYRLRTPSTGREILLEAEPGAPTSTARRASRSRSSARCSRSRRRSPSCRGRSRTCASATGATSWPRRTSTTAPPAAAAWPRSRADAPPATVRPLRTALFSPSSCSRSPRRAAAPTAPRSRRSRARRSSSPCRTRRAPPTSPRTPAPTPTPRRRHADADPDRRRRRHPGRPRRHPTPGSTGTTGTTRPPPARPEDSPTDTAPPAGSAPEKFEQFCQENAGAC